MKITTKVVYEDTASLGFINKPILVLMHVTKRLQECFDYNVGFVKTICWLAFTGLTKYRT